MTLIEIRELTPEELSLSQDIDVSGSGEFIYQYTDGEQQKKELKWQRQPFNGAGWARKKRNGKMFFAGM